MDVVKNPNKLIIFYRLIKISVIILSFLTHNGLDRDRDREREIDLFYKDAAALGFWSLSPNYLKLWYLYLCKINIKSPSQDCVFI